MTEDETPLSLYIPETKQQSVSWTFPGEKPALKLRSGTSHKKCLMLLCSLRCMYWSIVVKKPHLLILWLATKGSHFFYQLTVIFGVDSLLRASKINFDGSFLVPEDGQHQALLVGSSTSQFNAGFRNQKRNEIRNQKTLFGLTMAVSTLHERAHE